MTSHNHLDRVWYRDDEYALLESVGGDLIRPGQFGMSAVYSPRDRGHCCTIHYEIDAQDIFSLRRLSIRTLDGVYRSIGGVEPRPVRKAMVYENLNLRVPFTGKIRIRHFHYGDATKEQLMAGDFQRYSRILDVTIRGGGVIAVKDRSAEFEQREKSLGSRFRRVSRSQKTDDDLKLELDD